MDDRTLGLIYAIKQGTPGLSYDERICMFMREYTQSDLYWYSRESINILLSEVIVDYLESCDNPLQEIKRYFRGVSDIWNKDEYSNMISFLETIDVKDGEEYCNGFAPNPYPEFMVFTLRVPLLQLAGTSCQQIVRARGGV